MSCFTDKFKRTEALYVESVFYACTQTGDNNLWTQFDNLKVVYVNDINLL